MKQQKIAMVLPTPANAFRSADFPAKGFPPNRSVRPLGAESSRAGAAQFVGRAIGEISLGEARRTA
jgi:hypothetical protein